MKNYEYWKDFVSTGKINDYLHYIACTREEGTDDFVQASAHGADYRMNAKRNKEGGFSAGINYCDGDGSIGHAGW